MTPEKILEIKRLAQDIINLISQEERLASTIVRECENIEIENKVQRRLSNDRTSS